MGAGATKNSQQALRDNCVDCKRKFNPLTRKKKYCIECRCLICQDCGISSYNDSHLNTSLFPIRPTTVNSVGFCKDCLVLLSINPTYETLINLKVKQLKSFLQRRDVSVEMCLEKCHLVELFLEKYGGQSYRQNQMERRIQVEELASQHRVHPINDDVNSGSANSAEVDDPPLPDNLNSIPVNDDNQPSTDSIQSETKQGPESVSKISLSEIENVDEIDNLTAKQLKIILTCNFVDFRGCKERHEIIAKVKMLWESREANQRLYEKLLNPPGSNGMPGSTEEIELCKICMDSAIDCVLLECGHMVTCTKCGKQMNECPICRQYVVRAVHIFRA